MLQPAQRRVHLPLQAPRSEGGQGPGQEWQLCALSVRGPPQAHHRRPAEDRQDLEEGSQGLWHDRPTRIPTRSYNSGNICNKDS